MARDLIPLSGSARLAWGDSVSEPRAELQVPVGARRARPLALVIDAPEGHGRLCDETARAAKEAFVLCPDLAAWGPIAWDESRRLLRNWLARTKKRFGAHLAPGSVVLVARGSMTGLAMNLMREEPSFFERVVLIDGVGPSSTLATLFAERGGKKLMLLCSTEECRRRSSASLVFARRAGVAVRDAVFEGRLGAVPALGKHWSWLVQGDERWR